MRGRWVLALPLAALLAGAQAWPPGDGRPRPRVAFLSLDGGGAQILDRLVGMGAMPTLARLREEGAWAEGGVIAHFPSKTAAGHATLWTGAYGNVHGVTSNKMLRLPWSAHPITEVEEGFDARALEAEPIWTTAARQGLRSVVLYGTHLSPLSVYEAGGRWGGPYPGRQSLIDGYGEVPGKSSIAGQVIQGPWSQVPPPPGLSWPSERPPLGLSFRLGERLHHLWLLADPLEPRPGYDRVAWQAPGQALAWLEPSEGEAAWATGLAADEGPRPHRADLGLLRLKPEGQALLYLTPAMRTSTNAPDWQADLIERLPAFQAGAGAEAYKGGKFGPTWTQGGTGEAEALYLATVRHFLRGEATRVAALRQRRDWELAVHYLTFPDEALHLWYGLADPNTPYHRPALARQLWAALAEVGAQVDRVLASYREDPSLSLVVAADHGFAGIGRRFFPNLALAKAGLLALGPRGEVDLSRTSAYYPPTDGCFVVVNRRARLGGIVATEEVEGVLRRAEAALLGARDAQGRAILRRAMRPEAISELGVVGPRGGDLYLDPVPGTTFDAAASAPQMLAELASPVGGHLFDPRRPDMWASLAMAGPGIRSGVRLGQVRQPQIAPTVALLLGIQAPAQATGLPLSSALVPGSPWSLR